MNHKERAHAFMLKFLDPNTSHVVDMTCGNGHDTFFLAQHAYKVSAIDIQKTAIEATKTRCNAMDNVTYIHQAHETVDYEKMTPIQGAIYNLGYLPKSDKTIITRAQSTIASLQMITPYLQDFLVIAAYRGHEGGNEEYHAVFEYIQAKYENVQILRYETPLSPVTFLVEINKQQ